MQIERLHAGRRRRSRWGGAASALLILAATSASAQPAWPDLRKPGVVDADGSKDAAVIVGLEDYLFVPKVPGADANALDWYRHFTESRKIPTDRVHLVKDKAATREGILERVERATRQVAESGTLWFVFIGHGAPSKDGADGLLVGVDAQQTAVGLESRSVRHGELRASFMHGKQGKVVEVLDACFSGQSSSGGALAAGLQPLLLTQALAASAAATPNVLTLSAGTSDQFAGPLPNGNRPAFSYLVLGALRGWGDENKDGVVTAREAVDYASRTLAVTLSGRAQTPQLAGSDATFALSRGGHEAAPDVTSLVTLDGDGKVTLGGRPPSDSAAPSSDGGARKAWGWTALGLGAAALGAGGFFASQAVAQAEDFKSDPTKPDAKYDQAQASSSMANVALYTGLGLAGVGTWLLLTGRSAESPTARLLVGPGTIGIGGTFQ